MVLEVRNLKSIPGPKIIYCTMEVDNSDKLATDQVRLRVLLYCTNNQFHGPGGGLQALLGHPG